MKFNEQTVFTTFPGSSTLEFQSIENVPVYEPAACGDMFVHYYETSVATVDWDGNVVRLDVTTGRMDRWYTRPRISAVVTLGMRDKIGGYCFQFAQDGSIRSSCVDGTYYWGPIKEYEDPYKAAYLGSKLCAADLVLSGDLRLEHEVFRQNIEDSRGYDDDMTYRDKKDMPPATPEETITAMTEWLEWIHVQLGANPTSRDREMHEQSIRTARGEIERAKRMVAETCSECRRVGVCMCYT